MKKAHRIVLGILAVAALAAGPAAANVLSNPDFAAGGGVTSFSGTGGGGNSASPSWTVFNNTAGLTKTEHLASFAGRSGVIHVTTAGGSNGLVQVWAPINTGPSKVVTGATIYVRSGKVLIGTGNGGNTGANAFTSGTGQWESIRGPNQVCPANETIIYSAGGPADFYVDFASVEVLSKDPCPQTPGGPTGGKQLPDITSKKGITIGTVFIPWGGNGVLKAADSIQSSPNNACAFNATYDMVNVGPVGTSPAFLNRLKVDGTSVVAINSALALNAGETKNITTQPYLPFGTHRLSLALDDDHNVAESNETPASNLKTVTYTLKGPCRASLPGAVAPR